jgi:putative ABC transport system permease protein
MIWLTLRGLRARWWRAALTGLVAAIGIGIVTGTLIVSDTADRVGGDQDIDLIARIMLIAGAVALLVGAFVLNLTISVTVAQRRREMGLLRCVGAEVGQLRRSVLLEASVIGLAGAAIGLGLGVGVAVLLRRLIDTASFPGDLAGAGLVLTPRTVLAALLIGCVVTVLSALGPAARAGRMAPVAALHDLRPPARRLTVLRLAAGALLLGAGLAAVPVAVVTSNGFLLLPGGALALAGVRLAGPTFAGRLAEVVGAPVAGASGVPGALGRLNATRSPERTAAMASALMVGLTLLTLLEVLYASARAPLLDEYRRDHADFRLTTSNKRTGANGEPMPANIVDRLRALDGVDTVVADRCVTGKDRGALFCATDPAALARVIDLEVAAGGLDRIGAGGIAMSDDDATRTGAALGSPVTVVAEGATHTFTLAATYHRTTNFGGFLLTPEGFGRLGGTPVAGTVFVRAADRADRPALEAAVRRAATAVNPAIEVQRRVDLHEHDLAQMAQAAAVYRTLSALAAVVGLFGVVGTLVLSIVERRRELGLLRAVGMQRRQVRRMVRAEAVIVALVGAVLGLGLGVLFGWGGARVLAHSSSPSEFTLPVPNLALLAVLVAAAGVAAAVLPARLASRVDVLRALTTE